MATTQDLADKARNEARDVKKEVTDAAEDVKASVQDQIGKLEDSIRRNPVAAAGIAAGIGFLVAFLARR